MDAREKLWPPAAAAIDPAWRTRIQNECARSIIDLAARAN